jgi:hypothetical protein
MHTTVHGKFWFKEKFQAQQFARKQEINKLRREQGEHGHFGGKQWPG